MLLAFALSSLAEAALRSESAPEQLKANQKQHPPLKSRKEILPTYLRIRPQDEGLLAGDGVTLGTLLKHVATDRMLWTDFGRAAKTQSTRLFDVLRDSTKP